MAWDTLVAENNSRVHDARLPREQDGPRRDETQQLTMAKPALDCVTKPAVDSELLAELARDRASLRALIGRGMAV